MRIQHVTFAKHHTPVPSTWSHELEPHLSNPFTLQPAHECRSLHQSNPSTLQPTHECRSLHQSNTSTLQPTRECRSLHQSNPSTLHNPPMNVAASTNQTPLPCATHPWMKEPPPIKPLYPAQPTHEWRSLHQSNPCMIPHPAHEYMNLHQSNLALPCTPPMNVGASTNQTHVTFKAIQLMSSTSCSFQKLKPYLWKLSD
jgi:hypothetical protein